VTKDVSTFSVKAKSEETPIEVGEELTKGHDDGVGMEEKWSRGVEWVNDELGGRFGWGRDRSRRVEVDLELYEKGPHREELDSLPEEVRNLEPVLHRHRAVFLDVAIPGDRLRSIVRGLDRCEGVDG
jgi:hypothetical protein